MKRHYDKYLEFYSKQLLDIELYQDNESKLLNIFNDLEKEDIYTSNNGEIKYISQLIYGILYNINKSNIGPSFPDESFTEYINKSISIDCMIKVIIKLFVAIDFYCKINSKNNLNKNALFFAGSKNKLSNNSISLNKTTTKQKQIISVSNTLESTNVFSNNKLLKFSSSSK